MSENTQALVLRRCPHCGSKADFKRREVGIFGPFDIYWHAECTKCGCSSKAFMQEEYLKDGGMEARRQAAENWNRRVTRKAAQ